MRRWGYLFATICFRAMQRMVFVWAQYEACKQNWTEKSRWSSCSELIISTLQEHVCSDTKTYAMRSGHFLLPSIQALFFQITPILTLELLIDYSISLKEITLKILKSPWCFSCQPFGTETGLRILKKSSKKS